MELSPEALAFIEEEKKNQKSVNGVRLNPTLIRLIGKDPNKPNPEKMGKFFARMYDEDLKTYAKEEVEFGQGLFSGIILDVAYRAQWKYNENATAEYRTREFHDWKNEPIELLKITRGENGKTESVGTFPNTEVFKTHFRPVIMGVAAASPFDWHALVYIYHPATQKIVKYDVKGTGLFGKKNDKGRQEGGLWEYLNESRKAHPDVILKQILTKFGVEKEETEGVLTGYVATFEHGGIVESSVFESVVKNAKLLTEWQNQWKKQVKEDTSQPSMDEMPTIDAEADLKQPQTEGEAYDALKAQREKERAEVEAVINEIPF